MGSYRCFLGGGAEKPALVSCVNDAIGRCGGALVVIVVRIVLLLLSAVWVANK